MPDVPALTSTLLEDMLLVLGDETDRGPVTLLELADIHECRPILASAWQAAGTELSPNLAYEVNLFRRRAEGHRRVFAELDEVVPGIEVIKGFGLADLYPQGWVRGGKDLDLRVGDQDAVWAVARHLTDRGWRCRGAFVQRIGGRDAMTVALSSDPLDALVVREEAVEVGCTVFAPGNFFGLAPLAAWQLDEPLPPPVSHLLGVLEQRLERRIVGRDLVDSLAVLAVVDAAAMQALWDIVDRLRLWKELGELAFVLDELELVPAEVLAPARFRDRQRRAQRERMAAAARRAFQPAVLARVAGHRTATETWTRAPVRWLGERFAAAVPATRILAAGLPLVGAPIAPEATSDGFATEDVAGQLVARTPLGAFLLMTGREYEPETVASIRRHLGLAYEPDAG